ncbi:photosystem II reaction center Psb28 protein [Aristolochia californica]|uniref:photosystem II reaction center Psb28 protein n=1 Tax=Aristolochia californica TaxID=171875 RepID=UPI0035D76DA8
MAAMQCQAFSSPLSYSSTRRNHRPLAGLVSPPWVACRSATSSFSGQPLIHLYPRGNNVRRCSQVSRATTMMAKPTIQFIQGTDEQTIPDVRLTKSKDGSNGVATFIFDQPSVFDSSGELGDITGFYMIDEEGVLQSVDVNAKFVNGKPARIEAKYIMRSPREWDRFMRFMERYSNENGLQFVKK